MQHSDTQREKWIIPNLELFARNKPKFLNADI